MRSKKADPKWKEIRRYQGSTKPYTLNFKKNGNAIDITGWTIYFTVKKSVSDSDAEALINKKITNHSDPTNGKTLIELTANEASLEGNFWYSVDYKDDEGNEDIIVHGRIEFEKSFRDTRD